MTEIAMTPVQRLHAAFDGAMTDRVPVMPNIWVTLAARLTGTPLREAIEDPSVALRAILDAALLAQCDGAHVFLLPSRRTDENDGVLYDLDGRGRRRGEIDLAGGLATQVYRAEDVHTAEPYCVAFSAFRTVDRPLLRTREEARRLPVPDVAFFRSFGFDHAIRDSLAQAGDRLGLCGDCDAVTLSFASRFRGLEVLLRDFEQDPKLVHDLFEKSVACAVERGRFMLDEGLRVLRVSDSLANLSVITPELWRKFVLPHLKTLSRELHRHHGNARVYCHLGGSVRPFLRDLVDAGFDAIAPLDPTGGLSVADARQDLGDKTVLIGGVDTLTLLNGPAAKVKEESLRCLQQGFRLGHYILGSGSVLPPDTPRENIEAMAQAAREFSWRRRSRGFGA